MRVVEPSQPRGGGGGGGEAALASLPLADHWDALHPHQLAQQHYSHATSHSHPAHTALNPTTLITSSSSLHLAMTTTATFCDLPFELIEHILDLASSDYDLDSAPSASARSLFLSHCATVSRQFRSPAQATLWAALRIHTPAHAKRVLSSPQLGLYGTRHLDLAGVHAGHDGLSGTTAARVLAKIRGVRSLRLGDFGRLSVRVLQNDNLAGAPFPRPRTPCSSGH